MESSSSEEEVWSNENESAFFKAFSALKSNDPKIYDTETNFFVSTNKPLKKMKKNEKKNSLTLRDYERKLVVERGGRYSESEDDNHEEDESYIKNAESLKKEFKSLLESDESDTELLTKRVKTEEIQQKEEDDFTEWLKNEKPLDITDEDLQKLKKRWMKRDELDSTEQFLRDYLLEKKYNYEEDIEENGDKANPSYEEIIKREEEEDDRIEEFEHKYNFRFEDPDQGFIKQYPRTVSESIRNSTSRRRERRRLKKKAEDELIKKMLEEPDDDQFNFKFTYRTVPANDFGLTTEEILKADDKQLNAWVSSKRVCSYRSNEEEERDIKCFKLLSKNKLRKEKIFNAAAPLKKTEQKDNCDDSSNKKTIKKKRKQNKKNVAPKSETLDPSKKKLELDTLRLRSYGVRTKKLKRLLYKKKKGLNT